MRKMAQYGPDELVFLDEVHKNDKTPQRSNGCAKKGTRAVMRGLFVRGQRLSAVGALSTEGMIASTVVFGSMTRHKYLNFLEHSVVRYNAILTCHMSL